jgi:hypothetical protein
MLGGGGTEWPMGDRAAHFNGSARSSSSRTPQSKSWGLNRPGNGESAAFCCVHFFIIMACGGVLWHVIKLQPGQTNLIAPPGLQPQKYDNKPVCAGVWAWTAEGRRSSSVLKRENGQFLLGGGSPSFCNRAVEIDRSARSPAWPI